MARKRGNNEGSIFKTSNGKWRALISLSGKRLSFTSAKRAECQEWMRETQNQEAINGKCRSKRMTLDEYLNGWLINRKGSLRQSTWMKYEQLIRDYVIPYLGGNLVHTITTEQIQKLYNVLVKKGVGVPTIFKTHQMLHCAFHQAERMEMIQRNPVSHSQPPKPQFKEMKVFSEEENARFLIAVKGHRLEALFTLAVTTGMRQMELLGLRWSDINWAKGTIRVERQLVRNKSVVPEFISPKTRFGKRTIALGQKTIAVLRGHFERQRMERAAAGADWREYDLIFTNKLGGPLDHSNLVGTFKRILQAAELPDIRFHDLRHTFASIMLNNGISTIVVSRRLGHAKTSITTDVYGHLMPDIQPDIGETIDDLVFPVCAQLHQVALELSLPMDH